MARRIRKKRSRKSGVPSAAEKRMRGRIVRMYENGARIKDIRQTAKDAGHSPGLVDQILYRENKNVDIEKRKRNKEERVMRERRKRERQRGESRKTTKRTKPKDSDALKAPDRKISPYIRKGTNRRLGREVAVPTAKGLERADRSIKKINARLAEVENKINDPNVPSSKKASTGELGSLRQQLQRNREHLMRFREGRIPADLHSSVTRAFKEAESK